MNAFQNSRICRASLSGLRAGIPCARVSTVSAQLRSDDGSTVIDLNPSTRKVTLTAPGGVDINGTVTVIGDVVANGISLVQHLHGGVHSGTSLTGAAEG